MAPELWNKLLFTTHITTVAISITLQQNAKCIYIQLTLTISSVDPADAIISSLSFSMKGIK